jgi:transposase InsO family protein
VGVIGRTNPKGLARCPIAERRPICGSLIHHSDRGVQYACGDYTKILRDNDIQPSMSRVGNPYDNAKAESFMKTLKQEEVEGSAYRDVTEMPAPGSAASSKPSTTASGCIPHSITFRPRSTKQARRE